MIFYDDVSWSCEDCKAKLVVPYSHDQSTPLSPETCDFVKLADDAIQASGELKHCNNRVEISNQKRQKKQKKAVKKKAKVPLSDSHRSPELGIPQCSINCAEESELKIKSGPVSRDTSNSNEEAKSVQVAQVTIDDNSNCVESHCRVEALPIANPIWRCEICFATFS